MSSLGSAVEGGVTPEVLQIRGESQFVEVGNVELHVVTAGPKDGEPVVLLHGFPEFWYAWHEFLGPLADEGYRVIVPDQRGYHLSDKPEAVDAYHPDELADDVLGLLDALDLSDAHLVGHDWGAFVAWWVGLHAPDRLRTLSVLNVPHPTAFRHALSNDWEQRLKSWYVLFFQLPKIPEALAKMGEYRTLCDLMRRSSQPGTFNEADFDCYRAAWSRPGAYRSMVNWYRAIARANPRPKTERVGVPTLVLWGAKDAFLTRSLALQSVEYCENSHLVVLDDATHWIQHEEPVRVQRELTDHFGMYQP
ncbi:hydrolase or acyltransferase of alpha/beta superfamily protein [Halogeometricum borinquense DSM 11551]|uniref:Hydrolase or acyltransferase of alpha/beta superfamily protein n=1 Tax=Halogeometricum borinquense (strain ATCC 700274 / DSM 11551 / JCM 10706 / KCTC 4070 / PR3) TaxID=469382 RepID=E4NPF4_HALBP|nr:alpha/beta hydrolase [Halogeometricum borinquense]ADQ66509.1 predicted hydrolase or acyltransferase of alpha/beta superfamily [Halogeometricum borinquense DSM 11551]ELY30984.1 hydrolase or acyltransferase of alpha/beta superfamily protein [Halogeometricum borinquense DSM 11551]